MIHEEAEPLHQRCLAVFKAKLPAEHPNIKTVEMNYLLMKMKQLAEKKSEP